MKFTSYHDANEVVDDDFLSPVDQWNQGNLKTLSF